MQVREGEAPSYFNAVEGLNAAERLAGIHIGGRVKTSPGARELHASI